VLTHQIKSKELLIVAGLVPWNRKRADLTNVGIDDFYNMMDDFFTDSWPFRRAFAANAFKLDVQEDDKSYYVAAELPGVNKDEISVTMNEGTLQIAVTRDENSGNEDKNYVHRERRYCSMHRSLYLGDVDTAGLKARLDNGVLSLTVPKKEKVDSSVKVDIE
jgi:HSP20 family protein